MDAERINTYVIMFVTFFASFFGAFFLLNWFFGSSEWIYDRLFGAFLISLGFTSGFYNKSDEEDSDKKY